MIIRGQKNEYGLSDDLDYNETENIKFDVAKSLIEDEDELDEEEANTKNLKEAIEDGELLGYFNDARISTSSSTKFKKKKKEKIVFESGQQAIYKNKEITILYGPYENDSKQMYEVQLSDGSVTSLASTSIKQK